MEILEWYIVIVGCSTSNGIYIYIVGYNGIYWWEIAVRYASGTMGINTQYPLVNSHITMENHNVYMFNGKIHYFYGHFQ